MRNRFDRQLVQLNNELIEMGGMIEKAISDTVKALVNQDIELASNVIEYDEEIDHQEREIEQLCLKLLLQQQPVAKDLQVNGQNQDLANLASAVLLILVLAFSIGANVLSNKINKKNSGEKA